MLAESSGEPRVECHWGWREGGNPPSAYTSRMASFSGTAVVAACIALHTKKVTFLEG